MAFDWLRFFDRYAIPYVDKGRNVRRNNVSLPCPLCGDDPSENMGVSLVGRGWSCWRNERHRGREPHQLIMALLGCSRSLADEIVRANSAGFTTSDDSFAGDVLSRLGVRSEVKKRRAEELEMPEDFLPLDRSQLARKYAYPYLRRDRGYDDEAIEWLTDRYDLRFAISGAHAHRIIFPIYMHGELVSWTGRTVVRGEELRYDSLSDDPESAARRGLPVARMNVKECILDYDALQKGGNEIVVVEGPFDAARVTYFGERYGIVAAAMFSKTLLRSQVDLLIPLLSKFKKRTVLLDADAWADGFFTLPDYLGFQTKSLVKGDPGEMNWKQFRQIFKL